MLNIKKHIVVIGGGAGGLEFVARICKQFKNNKFIKITLIDNQLKHVWKPLLHEVASGTLSYEDEIDYFTFAYQKGFKFVFGSVQSLDQKNKNIDVKYLNSTEDHHSETIKINYDLLVIAVGSQTNYFEIPGVKEYCCLLDSLYEAEKFNKLFSKQLINITQPLKDLTKLNITIVGGGATGIELAAELNYVLREASKYKKHSHHHFKTTVIEASNRVLNNLPERISKVVTDYLEKNQINLITNTKITKVSQNGLSTTEGKFIQSQLTIWTTGVKGNLLDIFENFEKNNVNQIIVNNKLQTTKDENIFALGDCACCPQIDRYGKVYYVPARAQAAHQQAKLLAKSVKNLLHNKKLLVFQYKDYGSLITLSRYNVIGNLMTKMAKNFYIEGSLARFSYWLLYKKHLMILKGMGYAILSAITDLINKKQKPEIKLH